MAASTLGMTVAEIRDAVILAASTWNETGNSGVFRYTGTTPLKDVPSDCSYSVVYVRELCDGLFGQALPRCGGTQFVIYGNSRTAAPACAANVWANRAVSLIGLDAVGLMMHEFGHTLGVNHPASGERGIMTNGALGDWNNAGRVPFEWDLKCTEDFGGVRSLTGRKRSYTTGMGSSTTFGASGIGSASSALTDVSGTWYFAGVYPKLSSGVRWDTALDGTWVSAWAYPIEVGGFKAMSLREESTRDYVAYLDRTDIPNMTTATSSRETWAVYSDDDWSTKTFGRLQHCTSMASWTSCSAAGTANVAATGAVSTAWLGDISKSVFAWSHLDRSARGVNPGNLEIRISIGKLANSTLVEPTYTGIRSKVAPSVACMENSLAGYDCILLYVPAESVGLQLMSRRFTAFYSSNRYVAALETSEHPVADSKTANQVTAWWDSDESDIKVLTRNGIEDQELTLWKTDNGTFWQWQLLNFDTSHVPASAATSWRGSENRILYAN